MYLVGEAKVSVPDKGAQGGLWEDLSAREESRAGNSEEESDD